LPSMVAQIGRQAEDIEMDMGKFPEGELMG
jgi:hypothetical protein